MKISASIYSNKGKSLEQLVKELDAHGIDMFHIDCADDEKVFDDIAQIRTLSKTPIDLHIISATPEKYFSRISGLGIEYVSFQYENLKEIPRSPIGPHTKFGLSITTSTGLDELAKALPLEKPGFSFIMLMCTVPGQSGGVFNRPSFQQIIELKNRFPEMQVQVDGGVNDQVAFVLRLLGVNSVVSGSYLLNHEWLGAGMLSFHKAPNGGHNYKVADFAVPLKYLPVLNQQDLSFKGILQAIEQGGLGFVAITNKNGQLAGVISNADVRRGLLANTEDFNTVKPENLINSKPVTIAASASLTDMIRLLNGLNFIVLFLPVTDEENRLVGAVLLNNLTRV